MLLTAWASDLREHPFLPVFENGKPTGQAFTSLVALIRNPEGRPSGLHITFLKSDGSGKAPVDSPRRIIGVRDGSTKGGTVRLLDPKNGTIGLGEGIESTFSGSILTGVPGWSALTAGGIERAVLPSDIRKVFIFADRDPAGLKVAASACERFRKEGRESEILVPNERGQDFNDALQNKSAHQTAI
jgi:putative DNA primase/helicase